MKQQNDNNETDIIFQKLRPGSGERYFVKSPLDSVSNPQTVPQKLAKKRETEFVSTPTEKSDGPGAAELEFMDLISQGLAVGEACLRAGVSRASMYRRRNSEYPFRVLWDEALEIAADRLEEEADRRGFSGWEESVYYKGSAVGVRKRYSDRMLMFRLRALKPGRYSRVRG
ncbi:MAG: hypothetical protein ABL973_05620 [Micropepsaceae bacterium]